MSKTFQSPELDRQRPEIKGGAAIEAVRRAAIIDKAVELVFAATANYELPVQDDVNSQSNMQPEIVTIDDTHVDRALAAVIAAYENPETGFSNTGA